MRYLKVTIPADMRAVYEEFRDADPSYRRYAAAKREVRCLVRLPASQRTAVDMALQKHPQRALLRNWTVHPYASGAPELKKPSTTDADHVLRAAFTFPHPLDFVDDCFAEEQAAERPIERFAARGYVSALGGAALVAVAAGTFLYGATLISAACLIGGGALLAMALSYYLAARAANRQVDVWHTAGCDVEEESIRLATAKQRWQAKKYVWLDEMSRVKDDGQ